MAAAPKRTWDAMWGDQAVREPEYMLLRSVREERRRTRYRRRKNFQWDHAGMLLRSMVAAQRTPGPIRTTAVSEPEGILRRSMVAARRTRGPIRTTAVSEPQGILRRSIVAAQRTPGPIRTTTVSEPEGILRRSMVAARRTRGPIRITAVSEPQGIFLRSMVAAQRTPGPIRTTAVSEPEGMVPNKGKQALRKSNGKPKESPKTSLTKQGAVLKKDPIEPVEIKENTLTFPLLKTVDNGRLMPRYTSIINRTEEEGIRFEDLDILKIELKGLLANVSVRVRVLQGELKNLTNAAEDRKDKKRQIMDKAPASPAKRGKYDDKPIKKLKEAPVRGRDPVSSPPSIKITRVKSITVNGPVPPSSALPPEPEPPRIVTPRNDNPSKFWQSLEQYCSDITPMDIKFLEESIKCREKGPDLPPIPRLGEFFASRWAKEDLKAEQEASSSNERKPTTPSTSAIVGKRVLPKGTGASGPFTQRLVSALIEENVLSPKDIKSDQACKDGENITPVKSNKIVNSNNNTSSASLEKIVIKELEEQGLIEKDSQPKAPPNDELMCEISRVHSEVTTITAYNCKMLKQILHMAREQMPRQELKKKLRIIDNEVREVYRKFSAAKLKKKMPSKREKEQAWKVLKERDYLLRQLYGPIKIARGIVRPQSTQVRPQPEKPPSLKPPMGKGPVDRSRIPVQEKQVVEKSGAERQSGDGGHPERKSFEKNVEKSQRSESSFGKPNCVPLVKPPLDNPPMDSLMP